MPKNQAGPVRESAAGPSPNIPLIKPRDIAVLGMLCGIALAAWLVPERYWQGVSKGFANIRQAVRRDAATRTRHIERLAGTRQLACSPADCVTAYFTYFYQERLQLMRCYRPRGWQPRLRLDGREHVDRALADGKGAILWVTPLVFSHLLTKMAFRQAGFDVCHLSRYLHNFSETLIGARVLNPVRTKVERRYLADRLVMWPGAATRPLRQLSRRLKDNTIVSITVGHMGRHTHTLPFMDGRMRLATGPASLSLQSGVPLFPVFTTREPDGSFVTTVEPALGRQDGLNRTKQVEHFLSQYAGILESYVRRYTDQFHWHDIFPDTQEK